MLEKFTSISILENNDLVQEFKKNALNYFIMEAINDDFSDDIEEHKELLEDIFNSENTVQCIYENKNTHFIIFFNSLDEECGYVYNAKSFSITQHEPWSFAFYIEELFKGVSIKYISEYLLDYLKDNEYMSEELKRIEFQEDSFKMFNE